MPSELHLHPDRLLSHAAVAAALSEELRGALHAVPVADLGFAAEQERLQGAVSAAVRELAELSAALGSAAAAASAAEADVSGSLARLRDALGSERA